MRCSKLPVTNTLPIFIVWLGLRFLPQQLPCFIINHNLFADLIIMSNFHRQMVFLPPSPACAQTLTTASTPDAWVDEPEVAKKYRNCCVFWLIWRTNFILQEVKCWDLVEIFESGEKSWNHLNNPVHICSILQWWTFFRFSYDTSASSGQHSSLVPVHPGVCVHLVAASSFKPVHFDFKGGRVVPSPP